MRIPELLRHCVAFACYIDNNNKYFVVGTVFFVGLPGFNTSESYIYTVSAWHVIDEIRKQSVDSNVHVRINSLDGKVRYEVIPLNAWKRHPDHSIDVAAVDWKPSYLCGYSVLSIETFITEEKSVTENLGAGDWVYTIGLFIKQMGTSQNTPIVLRGSIALMPYENEWIKIDFDGKTQKVEAFLIESHSMGGLSGSPVFVHLPGAMPRRDVKDKLEMRLRDTHYLLGLLFGYFKFELDTQSIQMPTEWVKQINMGISIVIPATKIVEAINQPELREMREKGSKDQKDSDGATA
jgi:hypothetical protein